jgi:CubicO group peptidase (beta-lactamase class C family)
LVVLAAPAAAQGAPQTTDLGTSLDRYVREEMQLKFIPGAAVAVIKDGRTILMNGYGHADREHLVPAGDSTVYQIASITKLFTATAVVLLAEEGRLSIDDRIAVSLRGLPAAWSQITVRHLLEHSSGIPNYTEQAGFAEASLRDHTPRELIDMVAGSPLEFVPGSQVRYSNTGFVLLGILIEALSGRPYIDFLEEKIIEPLGLSHTRANDLDAIVLNRARGYAWHGDQIRNAEPGRPSNAFGAGLLLSSVVDLVKWDRAVWQNRLLSQSALRQMLNTERPLAWHTRVINGHRVYFHGGDLPGFNAEYLHFDDDSLTVIVLMNGPNILASAGTLAMGIARTVIADLRTQDEPPIRDPDPQATARFTRVIQHVFLDGTADTDLFTDEFKQRTTPDVLRAGQVRHALFGRLKKLELLERRPGNGVTTLRYRAVFERHTALAFVDLDAAGRIAGLGLQGL